MKLNFSTARAFVLAAAFFALPAASSQAASWPQATGPSIFDADFSNCTWTADAISETSCGFRLGTVPVGSYDIVNGALHLRANQVTNMADTRYRNALGGLDLLATYRFM